MPIYSDPIVFVAWPKDFGGPGFAVRSDYVEHCWCSIIGPTGLVLLRTVACFVDGPGRASLPVDELAKALGVGAHSGPNGVVPRTLARLERFNLALGLPNGELAVRIVLPPLTYRQVQLAGRLVQAAHDQYLTAAPVERPVA